MAACRSSKTDHLIKSEPAIETSSTTSHPDNYSNHINTRIQNVLYVCIWFAHQNEKKYVLRLQMHKCSHALPWAQCQFWGQHPPREKEMFMWSSLGQASLTTLFLCIIVYWSTWRDTCTTVHLYYFSLAASDSCGVKEKKTEITGTCCKLKPYKVKWAGQKKERRKVNPAALFRTSAAVHLSRPPQWSVQNHLWLLF